MPKPYKLFDGGRRLQDLILWGLPFLVVLGLSTATDADSGNLLRNPGFEIRPGQSIARHWHDNSGWADVDVLYAAAHGGDGRQFQEIRCTRYKSGAVQFVQRGLPVLKGRTYRLSVRMKGDVETPVEMILRKRGKPYTIYLQKAFNVTDQWQEISHIGTSPQADDNAVFHLRFTDTGRILVSNAEVRDITGRESVRKVPKGNLLPNGGFEVGLDRWGVKFRETGGYSNALAVEYANPKPEIVARGAAQGDRFLKLTLPKRCRVKVTSPYVPIQPNEAYTLSVWIAADEPRKVTFGLAGGYLGKGFKPAKTVAVGKRWKRYALKTQLAPAADDSYYFFLETSGKGAVTLDGISLYQGNRAHYESAMPAEIGFIREQSPAVVYQESSATVALQCANHAANDAVVAVTAENYWGNQTDLDRFSIGPRSSVTRKVKLPTDRTGYRKIRAAISIDHILADTAERAVAIVPIAAESRSADSAFGGHVRFNSEMLTYARMLGVRWLRTHPPDATKWFVVEKKKGEFVYFDEPFKLAKEMGFHLLGVLATTPRWASSAPADETAEIVGGYRSYPARDLRDWRNYIRHTVTHFKHVINHWEIWNEPDTQFLKVPSNGLFQAAKPRVYSDLMKVAHDAAIEANPSSVLIGGGAVKVPLAVWTEEVFKAGALKHLDVLSYHQYFTQRPGNRIAKSIASEVAEFNQLMSRYGSGAAKPIWNTEGGILFTETKYNNIGEVAQEFALGPDEAPIYLVKNYVRLLAGGVEKLFFYHLFPSRQSDRREGAGFFEWDGSPRPLAPAYAILARHLDGCRFVRYERDDSERVHAVFSDHRREVNVIWQKDETSRPGSTLVVKKQPGVSFVDIMGNEVAPEEKNGSYMLLLTSVPVYMIETF